MDNQTFQRIKDLITQHQAIGVVVRPNASLDEMAGGLGMYLVLTQMGKSASIASPTDPIVALSNLVGIQRVGKTLGGSSSAKTDQLTVAFPYKNAEDIEKVWYTQENGYLNIMVKGGPNGLPFTQKDVNFSQSAGAADATMPTLLFTIGVPRISDIGSIVSQDALKNMTVVNIDNKQENEKYGDVVVVSPKFSSVSEQVADFLTLLEPQIELNKDTSQNLLDGIAFATRDYTAQNTSYLAFEMAGILMKKGATRYKVPGATIPQGQPAAQYFPPMNTVPVQAPLPQQVQTVQPVQNTQQVQQPQFVSQPPMQQQSFQPVNQGNGFTSMPQPVQEFTQAPMPAPMNSAPMQQPQQPMPEMQNQPISPMQNQSADQAPADWLTPKVYKGSSVL